MSRRALARISGVGLECDASVFASRLEPALSALAANVFFLGVPREPSLSSVHLVQTGIFALGGAPLVALELIGSSGVAEAFLSRIETIDRDAGAPRRRAAAAISVDNARLYVPSSGPVPPRTTRIA